MSTTRVRIDPDDPSSLPEGRIDPARVDATTEAEIAAQERRTRKRPCRTWRDTRAASGGGWGYPRPSWRGASTCRTRRSATGNRASAGSRAVKAAAATVLLEVWGGWWTAAPVRAGP